MNEYCGLEELNDILFLGAENVTVFLGSDFLTLFVSTECVLWSLGKELNV